MNRRDQSLSIFLLIFGLLTLFAGGGVLFVPALRDRAGVVVPWVVWFNFWAGFATLLVWLAHRLGRAWTYKAAGMMLTAHLVMDLLLVLHVNQGGGFEPRTILVMGLRSLVWLAIYQILLRR